MKTKLILSIAAASLLAAAASTPAMAAKKAKKAKKEPDLFALIDSDLKSFDKAVFGPQKTAKAEKKSKKH